VSASVVGDLAISPASKDFGAVDDVSARGRDAVEEHHRRAVPGRLTGEPVTIELDRELGWLDGVRHGRPAR
jgi:hypothetical protein